MPVLLDQHIIYTIYVYNQGDFDDTQVSAIVPSMGKTIRILNYGQASWELDSYPGPSSGL
jgi:hypothetical protein